MGPASRALLVVAIVLVVAGEIAAVVAFDDATGYRWLRHEGCVRSDVGGPQEFWTPLILLDSPYGGIATGTAATNANRSETWTITDANGTAGAVLSLDNWSLVRNSNTSELGPGPNNACTASYSAVDQSRPEGTYAGLRLESAYLLASNATSDSNVPTHLAGSVVWSDSFSESTLPPGMACSSESPRLPVSNFFADRMSFQVPFAGAGTTLDVSTTVPAAVTYSYSLNPASSGSWNVDSSPEANGFGPAFDWSQCSAGPPPAG